MVDVSAKPPCQREAVATGVLRMRRSTVQAIRTHAIAKGNVFAAARIAGIQAAKRTGDLIPLCHPLALTFAEVTAEFLESDEGVRLTGTVRTYGPTGVEMEALTAVTVAALTVYDMCKAVDSDMEIEAVRLVRKTKSIDLSR